MKLAPWLLLLVGFWVLGAALLPPVQDEAYYALWGRYLAFGYFDHPPLVALLTSAGRLFTASALAMRLGTLITAVLTVMASLRFFRIVGLDSKRAQWTAIVLANFNIMGLAFGWITTPDTVLMLAWVLALSEGALALQGQERRWLTAGAATGLGLLSKYTMALMGPVFLIPLIIATRRGPSRGLRSPWPYLGGVVALLVFMPNLYWNSQHQWITLSFQWRHGMAMERPESSGQDILPRAVKAATDGPEAQLAAPFLALEKMELKEEKKPRTYDSLLSALNRYVGFYGSQIGLWGGMLVALGMAWRRRRQSVDAVLPSLIPTSKYLVYASTIAPLFVFGLLSLSSKVEANWSAMYVFGAAAWLAPLALRATKALAIGAVVNLTLGLVLLAHAQFSILPVRPHKDRLLRETHGYSDLTHYLANLQGPVFAETYQLVSMTRFYDPTLKLEQWPGITRDSELVGPVHLTPDLPERIRKHGSFWLAGTELPPPHLRGFLPNDMLQLRDCVGQKLQVISTVQAREAQDTRCKAPIHAWYLTRYEPSAID